MGLEMALNNKDYNYTDHLCTMKLLFCSLQTSLAQDPVVVASIIESAKLNRLFWAFSLAWVEYHTCSLSQHSLRDA